MPDLPIIIVEGEEDRSFLKELLSVIGLLGEFEFHTHCGGKDQFEKILKGLVTVNRKAIIIVADNDGDPLTSFDNIKAQIRDAGFLVPQLPREIIETTGLPLLSVLMIPWDNDPGCLETLCLSSVNPQYASQLTCADRLVQCAGAESWPLTKQAKLRMRGFLSAVCASDPNTGLRYAWSTNGGRPGNIFPLNVDAYAQIADYFRRFI